MRERTVGRSGLVVGCVGLGTLTWGRDTSHEEARGQLEAFVEAGGNLIDTSPAFGRGASEATIGELLDVTVDREDVILCTRGGFTEGPAGMRFGAGRGPLLDSLRASLERMNTTYVDVLLVAAPDPLARYALAYSALKMDAAQPQAHAKRALVKLLRERYGDDVKELARVWQRPLPDWKALEAAWPAERLPDGRNPHVAADLSAFLRLHAETYYSQVAQALKKHDPHHLYLGSRFAGRTPESIAACARWCDVVSFNLYIPSLREGFEAEEFARIDKPALLTEFHFGSSDRGPFWPGVMVVNTEAERGPAYRKMLESVLANRQFVGAHWFQYLDQPVTGRWLDGENGHLGLVGITDVPWHDFVLSVARTNRDVLGQLRREALSVSTSGKSSD